MSDSNAKRDAAAEVYAEHCYKNGLYPSVEQHFIYGGDARDVEVIGLQARILKLEAALEKCKRQRDNYGIIADYEYSPKFANSELDLILE